MRGQRDLQRVVIAAAVCALVVTLLPWEAVRLVAALLLAVFLPGYAIVAAAFGPHRLDPQRLLTFVLACGLSVLCLGGLVLDLLPGGIRTVTWALLLFLVIVGSSRAAALRRPQHQQTPARGRPRVRRMDLVFGAVALAAAIGALVLASTPLPAKDAAGYTTLWMLPEDVGTPPWVRIGVASAEQETKQYRLQIFAGPSQRQRYLEFELQPGEDTVLELKMWRDSDGGPTRVAASLYVKDRPGELYRRATTWLPPVGEGG